MSKTPSPFQGMSLYSQLGERKYLTSSERKKFLAALCVIKNPAERTFCEMIHWTGCRPSEALALTAINIDLDESMVIIRSLKKRGRLKGKHFRPVPLPSEFARRLGMVHGIRDAQASARGGHALPLWPFGRTKGWRLVRSVMDAAGLSGIKGNARGLRHALGVHAAVMHVPETRLQTWLGHASLETTSIYVAASGPEDRAIAARMWGV
ncbi:tyrosine-type recombinase/integrase [Roseibium algae]|uniref:Tyrosine-type recombinase/integrase n=1 Tax=Roseibium algae TaxID=3123038 RepID=A0ABU8TG02_9HYPH